MLDWLIVAFSTTLILTTFLSQFIPSIAKIDRLRLVSNYKFFFHPPFEDIYLLVREFQSNEASDWKMILTVRKRWYRFIWNPQEMLTQSLILIAKDLLFLDQVDKKRIPTSYAYQLLLAASMAERIKTAETDHIQFLIATNKGFEDPVLGMLFLSEKHPINSNHGYME